MVLGVDTRNRKKNLDWVVQVFKKFGFKPIPIFLENSTYYFGSSSGTPKLSKISKTIKNIRDINIVASLSNINNSQQCFVEQKT